MKFSIIIPVYNVGPYLRECLDSVLAQTYNDWEAICVDDGSTDGSRAVLDEYAAHDNRILAVHQRNAGVSAARNTGIDEASGEWMFYLDADDVIRPNSLEYMARVLAKENCDGLMFKPYEEFLDTNDRGPAREEYRVMARMGSGYKLMTGEYSANGYVVGRIYRREKFRHVRFPIGIKMMEDVRYWTDAIAVDAKWVVVRGSYYLCRDRAGSASHGRTDEFYRNVAAANVYAVSKLKQYGAKADDLHSYWKQYHGCYTDRLRGLMMDCGAFDFKRMQLAVELYDSVFENLGFVKLIKRDSALLAAARCKMLGPARAFFALYDLITGLRKKS